MGGPNNPTSSQLNRLHSELRRHHQDVVELKNSVGTLSVEHADTKRTVRSVHDLVETLQRSLDKLSAQYAVERVLQEARARSAELTAEIDRRFGDRERVRRLAAALSVPVIVDAVTKEVFDKSTVRGYCTELALSDSGFWLTPAALSLAANYSKEEALEQGAHRAALSLDERRTNLFMALTLFRAGDRELKASVWLDGYLDLVTPNALDDDFLVLLDAIAQGELGALGWTRAEQRLRQWRAETVSPDSVDTQVATLRQLLTSNVPLPGQAEFPALSGCVVEWERTVAALRKSRASGTAAQELSLRFPSPDPDPARGTAQRPRLIEGALNGLITHREGDEAELEGELARQQLIIRCGGDIALANRLHEERPQRRDTPMSLPALLVQAAFPSDNAPLDIPGQHMALVCAQDWVARAGKELALEGWRDRPAHLTILINGWRAELPSQQSKQVDEEQLVRDFRLHLDKARQRNRLRRIAIALIGAVVLIPTLAFVVPKVTHATRVVLDSVGLIGLLIPVLVTVSLLLAGTTQLIKLSNRRQMRRCRERHRSGSGGIEGAVALLRQALAERQELLTQWSLAHDTGQRSLVTLMTELGRWSPAQPLRPNLDQIAATPPQNGEQSRPDPIADDPTVDERPAAETHSAISAQTTERLAAGKTSAGVTDG